MKPSCRQIEGLIDKRELGLSEAERLTLEQHLTACVACSETARLMELVHRVTDAAPETRLSESARSRVITSALNVSRGASVRQGVRIHWVTWPAAVAAAVLLGFGLMSGQAERQPQAANRPAVSSAKESRHDTEQPSAQPPSAWLENEVERTLLFAEAHVTLAPGSRVRLDREHKAIEIERGALGLDVPAGHELQVITRRLRVEVLGSRATVSNDWIEVERGAVEVSSLDGKVSKARVAQGARVAAQDLLLGKPPELAPDVQALLSGARKALGQGDVKTARELASRAERGGPARKQRAELDTLRAECFLLERDRGAAIEQYLKVAERYAELSAGDNALYAAVQLSERAGDGTRARALLERYLARYPRGRFADEARVRLNLTQR